MKTLRYKIITIIVFLFVTVVIAQKQEKKATEKFAVNKDVLIDVNTRYTDIEIETWDKNEVVISAYIVIEDEQDQKTIDSFLKKWNFEALGNKSAIKITSKSLGLIDIHSFNFDAPNYDLIISESVSDALENLHFEIPEIPEIPELPMIFEMHELPELPPLPSKFDFKEYRKDKSYLIRWKKENKDIIGKNAKIKVGRNSISINSDDDDSSYKWNITTEGKNQLANEIAESVEKAMEKRQKAYAKRQEALKKRQKELQTRIKERNTERKLDLIKRQEAHERRVKEMAKRRVEVRDILKKREKMNIKRVIKIKAPKNAKFNMNVKYGSMSFPN